MRINQTFLACGVPAYAVPEYSGRRTLSVLRSTWMMLSRVSLFRGGRIAELPQPAGLGRDLRTAAGMAGAPTQPSPAPGNTERQACGKRCREHGYRPAFLVSTGLKMRRFMVSIVSLMVFASRNLDDLAPAGRLGR